LGEQIMDWSLWLYGVLAVTIAVVLSSVELLTKYQSRNLREIFFSRYYGLFALLNAVFCCLVYAVLPHLSKAVVNTELAAALGDGPSRALTAGLGYLLIARLSFLDITTRSGETYGAGFDGIYNAFAQYLLRHHSGQMRKAIRDDFFTVFKPGSGAEEQVFTNAANLLYKQMEAAQQAEFKERLDLALAGDAGTEAERCLPLYELIRNYTTGNAEAEDLIQKQR
jgi:hypothetical protein